MFGFRLIILLFINYFLFYILIILLLIIIFDYSIILLFFILLLLYSYMVKLLHFFAPFGGSCVFLIFLVDLVGVDRVGVIVFRNRPYVERVANCGAFLWLFGGCLVVVVEWSKGGYPIISDFKGDGVTPLISAKNFFTKVCGECLTGFGGCGRMVVQGVWKAGFLRDLFDSVEIFPFFSFLRALFPF